MCSYSSLVVPSMSRSSCRFNLFSCAVLILFRFNHPTLHLISTTSYKFSLVICCFYSLHLLFPLLDDDLSHSGFLYTLTSLTNILLRYFNNIKSIIDFKCLYLRIYMNVVMGKICVSYHIFVSSICLRSFC